MCRKLIGGSMRRSGLSTTQCYRRGSVAVDIGDKAKPAFVHRANQVLVVAIVPDGTPRRTDTGTERSIRDDAALPDRFDQLVPADSPVAVADQVDEHVKYLRLDVNNLAGAAQLLPRGVDLKIGEADIQNPPVCEAASSRSRRATA